MRWAQKSPHAAGFTNRYGSVFEREVESHAELPDDAVYQRRTFKGVMGTSFPVPDDAM